MTGVKVRRYVILITILILILLIPIIYSLNKSDKRFDDIVQMALAECGAGNVKKIFVSQEKSEFTCKD